jgi:hypothetical protein
MQTYTATLRRVFCALALLVPSGFCAGCAQQPCTVTGRVTFLGQPVTGGSVVLYGEGQFIVRGPIGADGTYTIPNVPRGPVRVAVAPPLRLPEGMRRKYPTPPAINGPIVPDAESLTKDFPTIPARYGVPEESGLAVTVENSVTEFDITLTR